jgi:DNA-binding NtrC family response regulator
MPDQTANPMPKILVLDDDAFIRMALSQALASWNYSAVEAGTVAEALKILETIEPEAALLDIQLPDGSGHKVLEEIRSRGLGTAAVMITGNVDVENTLAALRGGAVDFIGKPIRLEELRITLNNVLELRSLRREVAAARRGNSAIGDFSAIIGESFAIKKAIDLAKRVAASDVAGVLLQGETGTGKDLFARAIHTASSRAEKPFMAINCAALPATLIESELFGYEKGAFTDAKQRKEGLFEQARGGTIFLDEIGELELPLQAKLLRVLENGLFRRVGGLRDLPLDARIIAASNRNLKKAGEEGLFRLDLYFRLSIIEIDIPPLREREKDVLLIAKQLITKANEKRRGKPLRGLTGEVESIFLSYSWPGNVRELRNVVERCAILEDGEYITTAHLPADLSDSSKEKTIAESASAIRLPEAGISLEVLEYDLARQALEREGGNLTRAARLLNISRDQLRYRLKNPPESRAEGKSSAG